MTGGVEAIWSTQQLAEKLLRAAGGVPPLDMRPRLAALNAEGGIALRYEWVKDFSVINEITEKSGWDLSDGQEWFSFTKPV